MKVKIKELDAKKLYGVAYLDKGKNGFKILVPKTLPGEIVEIDFIK